VVHILNSKLSYIQPTWNFHVAATDTLGIPQAFHLALLTPLGFSPHMKFTTIYICTLNWRHFAYRTSRTTYICTLTLSTSLVEHIISSIRMTTRSRWNFRIYIAANDLTLYSLSSLYIFVTWGWPTVAETCRQPNKTDTKTVVFWCTYPLPIPIHSSQFIFLHLEFSWLELC